MWQGESNLYQHLVYIFMKRHYTLIRGKGKSQKKNKQSSIWSGNGGGDIF